MAFEVAGDIGSYNVEIDGLAGFFEVTKPENWPLIGGIAAAAVVVVVVGIALTLRRRQAQA